MKTITALAIAIGIVCYVAAIIWAGAKPYFWRRRRDEKSHRTDRSD